ncbi:MAG: PilC/PilY family type IV pilus protein [Steroidobacteraceae bacterium]
MQRLISKTTQRRIALALASASYTLLWGLSSHAMAAAPPISISQVPLTVTLPAHPQILLAVGNSQSMDGDLSGAIYTGSGSIPHPLLFPSSSPVNFTIPAGFTPPVNPGAAGVAPYTVNSGGQLLDNSASRLNVAKAGIASILNSYMDSADFGLMEYHTSGLNAFNTWVYQMSQPGGFTFTNNATPPANAELVLNPCYQVVGNTFPVERDCTNLQGRYGISNNQKYMVIAASSDDPAINDVLYAGGGTDPVCVVFNGPNPPNPFPPNYTLGNYNSGGVFEGYGSQINNCARTTGPTNAGFVPYSAEVMYEQRGFGFYTFGESPNDGTVDVPMTSSGAAPTAASVAAAIAQFTPRLQPETNSTGSAEMKASATQSPVAGLIAQARTLYAGNPPTTNGCPAQRYVVLMTDGLPTMDLAGRAWPPLGSSAAVGYGVTATFNTGGNGALIATNDQALIDVVAHLTSLNSGANPIKTYIIGLGAGVDPAVNPAAAQTLTAMAVAGGTNTYFPATTPQDVSDDLQAIITKILDQAQSTSSAAVNSTGLNANSIVYQSQFVTSDLYQDWTGNLYAYPVNPANGVVNTAAPVWSGQTNLDLQLPASRILATWDPVQRKAIPFEWTAGTPVVGIGATTLLGQDLMAFPPDPNGSDVLGYLRGDAGQEVRNSGKFRNRAHLLGDIVDSNPAFIGPSNENIQSSSYIAFAASTATRPPVIYIGANDGMLHAFDVAMGTELFAYIPSGVYANLVKLANPYYNASHRFFVNGSPQAADVQFLDSTWHTLLVGTEGAGGNSVYALDVTNPTAVSSESALARSVLWDFTDIDMGLGYSTPVIANTAYGWTVLFGNGYNSANQKPFLYALDPQTGIPAAKIDLCGAVPTACNLGVANGLSSLIAVNSGGQVAGLANIVYAGDLQGNMWRVDMSNPVPALWSVTVLFQARDALGNMQPITTKPVASLNPRFPQVLGTMVLFGTGQFLGVPDLANQNVQSIYGVYDPPAGYVTPLARTNLLQQTLNTAMLGSTQVRTVSGTKPVVPTNKGWYIDLSLLPGERVINDPRLQAGGELVLTTYQPVPPSQGSCNATGTSYFMVLNYATGGSFTSPQFDANGDGKINSSDTVVPNGGSSLVAPVGMSLGSVYASAPTLRSGSFTTGTAIALITLSTPGLGANGTGTAPSTPVIKPVILKGASKARTAWWEIRQ